MTEKRLIDANDVYALFSQNGMARLHVADIDAIPRVDAVEVVHGEWNTIEDDYVCMTALECSVCNQEYWFEDEPPMKIYNYCPNCGSKMYMEVSE